MVTREREIMRSRLMMLMYAVGGMGALAACARDAVDGRGTAPPSTNEAFVAALTESPGTPSRDDFAGATSCASCHAQQYAVWRASTHGMAGGVPGTATRGDRIRVIAPFNGVPLRFRDAIVTPREQGGAFQFVVQRPNERDTSLTVDAVIGGGHMLGGGTQGFVTTMPDGTQRFLPFDWSRHSRTWFCNTGTRTNQGWLPISPTLRLADCGDWPPSRVLGDEPRFSNCQSCHGSQIGIAFDTTAKRWETQSNGLAINCESCHGPAARHVRLMRSAGATSADIGLPALATLNKEDAVAACLSCHALKTRLVSGYLPGATLTQFYSVLLAQVGEEPLTADGRTRTFAYQEGHLASACYRNGTMTCTSCHDPHSQHYRSATGEPLPGRFDDRQCTSCHASKAERVSQHTKHRPGSPGSACVACHMNAQQQRELGDAIPYARSDHTIAIPRPAVDSSVGIVSACRTCHASTSETKHEAQVQAWWGALKPHEIAVAGVLAARTLTDGARATALLLQPTSDNPVAQVAGLSRWLVVFGSSDGVSLPPEAISRLRTLGASPNVDVRALALATLHHVRGGDAEVRRFLRQQAVGEGVAAADVHAVRRRWAMILGGLGDDARGRNEPAAAVIAYQKALAVTPNDPRLLVSLGLALALGGDLDAAVNAYAKSLALDPRQPLAQVNLGIAYGRSGRHAEADRAFRAASALDPTSALGYMNLGTTALRDGRSADAILWLERALAREAGLATGHFQLALAYLREGNRPKAEAAVRRSVAMDPSNKDAVDLLATLQEARGAGPPRR